MCYSLWCCHLANITKLLLSHWKYVTAWKLRQNKINGSESPPKSNRLFFESRPTSPKVSSKTIHNFFLDILPTDTLTDFYENINSSAEAINSRLYTLTGPLAFYSAICDHQFCRHHAGICSWFIDADRPTFFFNQNCRSGVCHCYNGFTYFII